jgi:hypothetical protein
MGRTSISEELLGEIGERHGQNGRQHPADQPELHFRVRLGRGFEASNVRFGREFQAGDIRLGRDRASDSTSRDRFGFRLGLRFRYSGNTRRSANFVEGDRAQPAYPTSARQRTAGRGLPVARRCSSAMRA